MTDFTADDIRKAKKRLLSDESQKYGRELMTKLSALLYQHIADDPDMFWGLVGNLVLRSAELAAQVKAKAESLLTLMPAANKLPVSAGQLYLPDKSVSDARYTSDVLNSLDSFVNSIKDARGIVDNGKHLDDILSEMARIASEMAPMASEAGELLHSALYAPARWNLARMHSHYYVWLESQLKSQTYTTASEAALYYAVYAGLRKHYTNLDPTLPKYSGTPSLYSTRPPFGVLELCIPNVGEQVELVLEVNEEGNEHTLTVTGANPPELTVVLPNTRTMDGRLIQLYQTVRSHTHAVTVDGTIFSGTLDYTPLIDSVIVTATAVSGGTLRCITDSTGLFVGDCVSGSVVGDAYAIEFSEDVLHSTNITISYVSDGYETSDTFKVLVNNTITEITPSGVMTSASDFVDMFNTVPGVSASTTHVDSVLVGQTVSYDQITLTIEDVGSCSRVGLVRSDALNALAIPESILHGTDGGIITVTEPTSGGGITAARLTNATATVRVTVDNDNPDRIPAVVDMAAEGTSVKINGAYYRVVSASSYTTVHSDILMPIVDGVLQDEFDVEAVFTANTIIVTDTLNTPYSYMTRVSGAEIGLEGNPIPVLFSAPEVEIRAPIRVGDKCQVGDIGTFGVTQVDTKKAVGQALYSIGEGLGANSLHTIQSLGYVSFKTLVDRYHTIGECIAERPALLLTGKTTFASGILGQAAKLTSEKMKSFRPHGPENLELQRLVQFIVDYCDAVISASNGYKFNLSATMTKFISFLTENRMTAFQEKVVMCRFDEIVISDAATLSARGRILYLLDVLKSKLEPGTDVALVVMDDG